MRIADGLEFRLTSSNIVLDPISEQCSVVYASVHKILETHANW